MPDGQQLIVGGTDGRIVVIDADRRTAVRVAIIGAFPVGIDIDGKGNFLAQADRIVSFSVSEDGKTVLTAGQEHAARLWSYPSFHPIGELFSTFHTDTAPYGVPTLTEDGNRLSLPTTDGTVVIDLRSAALAKLACQQGKAEPVGCGVEDSVSQRAVPPHLPRPTDPELTR